MNRTGILATLLAAAAAAQGTDVEQVIVRQQWPWSTDVKVEYRLSGVSASAPVDISVTAYNGGTELDGANLAAAMHGDLYGVTKPVGTITIDPVKAFGTGQIALDDFKVKLTLSTSAANIHETLYKIFDLTNGCACTDVTRADLLSRRYGAVETDFGKIGPGFNTSLDDVIIWTGVTNDVKYKTTHLVMRKIPANGVTTRIGRLECQSRTEENAAIRTVSFTNDYYMGVFEFTEGQLLSLSTNTPGSTIPAHDMRFTNELDRYVRPVNMADFVIRYFLSRWPGPNSYGKGPFPNDNSTVIGNLRKQSGLVGFDLPTEAVWEYACRAGTTNDYNSGLNYTSQADYERLARTSSNAGNLTYQTYASAEVLALPASEGGTAIVGSYAPNAWGLYDMHGNMTEMCLDRYEADVSYQDGSVDPWGPPLPEGQATDLYRVGKGGAYWYNALTESTSSSRMRFYGNNSHTPNCGFRVCLTVY